MEDAVPVSKTWVNETGEPNPESVTAQLLRNGAEYKTVVLNADNEWKHEWTGLALEDLEGNAYTYTVDEAEVPGYDKSIDQETGEITNTRKTIADPITAKKVWVNGHAPRPTVWFKLYRQVEGGTAEEVPGAEIKELPNGITTAKWVGLAETDLNGKVYTFSVKEVNATGADYKPNGYNKTEDGLTVTNTYDGLGGEDPVIVNATKEWKDVPEGQATPASVVLRLTGAAPQTPEDKTANADNSWTVSWTVLRYKADGTAFVYGIDEVAVPGYNTEITGNQTDGFTVTNTYDGLGGEDPVTVNATKVWAGIPKDAKAFPKATLTLLRNGVAFGTPIELEATGNGSQEAKWANLLKYAPDGTTFTYAVEERSIANGYAKTVSEDGLTITNTYDGVTNNEDPDDPKKQPVTIVATKVWAGIPEDAKTFPKATLTLLRNGVAFGTPITLTATGNGSQEAKWENLPKYAPDGKDYVYTVGEPTVPENYKMTQDGNTITNTYTEPTPEPKPEPLAPGSRLTNNLAECFE